MNEPIPKFRTVDGAALMSLPLRPPNFVVDTLLSQGLHILAGSPKVGKSWLALWLAVTVAKGEQMPPPCLPIPTEKPGANNRKRKSPWDTRRMNMGTNPHGNHPCEYFSGKQRKMLDRR